MKIIPEKYSKRWILRLIISTLVLTVVFSLAFGVKIRGEVQSELVFKYMVLAAIFNIIHCFFGILGLKRIYLFMMIGSIAGMIYLLYMAFISNNGAFQLVGFMSFVEFIFYSGLLGVIGEIYYRIKHRKEQ